MTSHPRNTDNQINRVRERLDAQRKLLQRVLLGAPGLDEVVDVLRSLHVTLYASPARRHGKVHTKKASGR